ncbi:MAG: EthD family reductase [Chloroflexi bacterium]|nr:EthD family reductase [Chloroflexota bacterium]
MFSVYVLYGHPTDPEAFERYYDNTHLPLAARIPNMKRAQYSRIVGTPDGGEPAYYRIATLIFDSQEQAMEGLGSPDGQAAVQDLANFATGGATVVLAQTQEVTP